MAWMTLAELRTAVASVMGESPADDTAPTHRDEILTASLRRAKNYIIATLSNRGYTAAQAESWDMVWDYHRALSLCNCLRELGLTKAYDSRYLDEYCKAKEELESVVVVVAAEDAPQGKDAGNIGVGTFDATEDIFGPDFVN